MITLSSLALIAGLALAPAPPPDAEQVTRIPPELRAMLREHVIDRTASRQQRLELLVGMIFSDDGLALQYDTSATHSVAETFASRRANCLSFTLLLVTLAREAGLQARPQEVGRVLSWYQDQGTAYNFGHVNALVKVDGRTATVDLDSNILMDRRGPRPISDQRLLAHYYNNRGAELMAQGERPQARTYFQRALALQPELPDSWNNLGVLELRDGHLEAAARNYATALALDPQHEATLSNSINLYRRLGDDARVARLLLRLQRVREVDPFQQYMLGNESERRGDYATAIRYYRRAIRLYDSAHQFHFGLARAYFLDGDGRRAEQELRRARELGQGSDRDRYQAKLDSLHRWARAGSAPGR